MEKLEDYLWRTWKRSLRVLATGGSLFLLFVIALLAGDGLPYPDQEAELVGQRVRDHIRARTGVNLPAGAQRIQGQDAVAACHWIDVRSNCSAAEFEAWKPTAFPAEATWRRGNALAGRSGSHHWFHPGRLKDTVSARAAWQSHGHSVGVSITAGREDVQMTEMSVYLSFTIDQAQQTQPQPPGTVP